MNSDTPVGNRLMMDKALQFSHLTLALSIQLKLEPSTNFTAHPTVHLLPLIFQLLSPIYVSLGEPRHLFTPHVFSSPFSYRPFLSDLSPPISSPLLLFSSSVGQFFPSVTLPRTVLSITLQFSHVLPCCCDSPSIILSVGSKGDLLRFPPLVAALSFGAFRGVYFSEELKYAKSTGTILSQLCLQRAIFPAFPRRWLLPHLVEVEALVTEGSKLVTILSKVKKLEVRSRLRVSTNPFLSVEVNA